MNSCRQEDKRVIFYKDDVLPSSPKIMKIGTKLPTKAAMTITAQYLFLGGSCGGGVG